MVWNIVLASLAALSQGVNAWLGHKVTGAALTRKRRLAYDIAFIVVALIGVTSVGIMAYRGARSERAHFSVEVSAIG